jgi:hypothetical protein
VDAVSRGLLMNRPAILFDPDPGFRCIGLEAARLVLEGTAHSRAGTRPTPRELLLDVFGNPFRPVAVDPAWRTPDVITLAEGIYADRASDRMPILADALQDAGCDNEDVLSHCRGGGPHVRGCWVVDLVLGKE